MKQIELSRGMVALVDDEDYEELSRHKWSACQSSNTWVAVRDDRGTGLSTVYMHRQLLGFPACDVDHKNRNGLDNRRENLRRATRSQNLQNAHKYQRVKTPCTSQYKGVSFQRNGWRVGLKTPEKVVYVGRFRTEIAAAIAYDCAARKHFGPFARLNFPYGAG